jgi:hypothetical protein
MAVRCDVLFDLPGQRDRRNLALDVLPFSAGDVTAGSEDELQAVVIGGSETCDLPITIRNSRFFRNIARRSASGVAPERTLNDLQLFLNDSRNVWENSWVRFPARKLSTHALETLPADRSAAAQTLPSLLCE